MLSIDDIRKALKMNEFTNGDMAEDVELVVYRRDIFEYDNEKDIDVHIDIELEYGEFLEFHEDDPTFKFLLQLCELPTESDEFILYSK
ncbi:MAG: hypothetical protein K2G32_07110 [Oscillospiraceae bacterium]|nr:hypothetical protein [Oscillospiraceae bacterium]